MREWQSQAHVKHYCKYHVVFVPKYRRKSIYGALRKDIGRILRELCRQQGVELIEGYAMKDHIHMLLMIPPKFSVEKWTPLIGQRGFASRLCPWVSAKWDPCLLICSQYCPCFFYWN